MATITTRAGKGSPLTNNEVDANFTNLNTDKQEVLSEGSFADGDKTKLDGIESGATADQTAQEIATAIDADATAEATLKSALGLGTSAYTPSTDYVAVTGDSMTGNLSFGDNDKAIFGAGNDLQIYHDPAAGHSQIREGGSGNLYIAGSNIVIEDTSGVDYITAISGGAVSLTHSGTTKLATTSTGIDVTGNATFADNGKAIFGAGNDLQIYHDGTSGNSHLTETGSGNFYVRADNLFLQNTVGATYLQAISGGETQLRYNNSAKLATTSTGIDVTGEITADGLALGDNQKATFGASDDLQIYHDGSHSYIHDAGTGNLRIAATNFYVYDQDTSVFGMAVIANDRVEINYAGSKKFATTSTGIDVTGTVTADGLTVDGTTYSIIQNNDAGALKDTLVLRNYGSGSNASGQGVKLIFAPTVNDVSTRHAAIASVQNGSNSIDMRFYTCIGDTPPERMRIAPNGDISFYEDTGTTPKFYWDASAESLGIGTTSPANKLDVWTGSFNSSIAHFTGANAGRGLVLSTFARGSNDDSIDYDVPYSGGAQSWSIAGTEKMRLDQNGNVGIGTDSPSTKLAVSGSVAGTAGLNISGAGWGVQPYVANSLVVDNNSGQSRFFATGADASTDGSFLFYTSQTDGGANERMRIDSSGNVGIGTTATSGAKLKVDGGATAGTIIQAGNAQGGVILGAESSTAYVNTTSSTPLAFEINNAERMRIDSSGRVGIGTNSPATQLHIAGDANADSGTVTNPITLRLHDTENIGTGADTTNPYAKIEFYSNDLSDGARVQAQIGSIYGSQYGDRSNLAFYTAGAGASSALAERMRIDSSGNVSIGTTTANSKLNVASSQDSLKYNEGITVFRSVGSNKMFLNCVGGGANIVGSNSPITFNYHDQTSNAVTERMRIDSSGNVGIGTSSPAVPLDVNGSAQVSGRILVGSVGSGGGVSQGYQFAGDGNTGMYQDAYDQLQFSTNNAERMRIDSSGNVGIGRSAYGSISTDGFWWQNSSNYLALSASGTSPIYMNRNGSEGGLINFYYSGSTVGAIGSIGSDLYIGNAGTTIRFVDSSSAITPRGTNGSTNDAAVDFGTSSERFKDLYLSGGVYLGGTGSANKLDDYETGIYQPTGAPGTSGSYSFGNGSGWAAYEKIGDIVHVHGYLIPVSVTSPVGSYWSISLPFTSATGLSDDAESSAVTLWYQDLSAGTKTLHPAAIFANDTNIYVYMDASLLTFNDRISFSGTYRAA